MSRRPALRVALGLLLLALAAGAVFLARGTADAADAFREHQAEWQRGLEPVPAAPPGVAQRAGETMLGIARPQRRAAGLPGLPGRPRRRDRGHDLPAGPSPIRGDRDPRTAPRVTSKRPGQSERRRRARRRHGRRRSQRGASSARHSSGTRSPRSRGRCARTRRTPPPSSTSRCCCGDGAATEEPSPSLGVGRPSGGRATRTPATRRRRRARKAKGSEPMLPLAQLVFLTPWAALVGLAFVVPLARARDPRASRTRACARTSSLLRPRAFRLLAAPARARGPGGARCRDRRPAGDPGHRLHAGPLGRRALPHVRRQPLDAGDERAGRRRAVGARTRSRHGCPAVRSPTFRPASRRSRTG